MLKNIIKIILLLCLLLLLSLILTWWFLSPSPAPASQAFINTTVLTMDASNTQVEAILVRDNKIAFVGSTQTVMSQTDEQTVIHDLQDNVLMPGIIDAHGHFPGDGIYAVAVNLNPPPISTVTSISHIQQRLKEKITSQYNPKRAGQWIYGFGFDETLLTEKRFPNRYELDAVSTKHPIFISHISGHFGVVNSAGLERLNINEQSLAPEGGEFVKDDDGELTGVLKETASTMATEVVTNFSLYDSYHISVAANRHYVSHGVTTAQNGAADPNIVTSLRLASKLGLIPIRLQLWPTATTSDADRIAELKRDQTDLFSIGAVKLIVDGSIQGYTGYLRDPYHVVPNGEDANFVGHALIPKQSLNERVNEYHQRGIQMALHGNGDAAIDDILDAIDAAQKNKLNTDARHILVHAQMARDDQLERMKALGVTPSFFSVHTYYWGDRHNDLFMGPERAARMSPAKSAQDLGLVYSIHLDSPVVPMQPMRLVWSAVNRISSGDNVIGENQRISPIDALRATTIDAAWQIFQEDKIGSIETGKLADLIVLDQNPLLVPHDIDQIKVLRTYVGGREVFNSEK